MDTLYHGTFYLFAVIQQMGNIERGDQQGKNREMGHVSLGILTKGMLPLVRLREV